MTRRRRAGRAALLLAAIAALACAGCRRAPPGPAAAAGAAAGKTETATVTLLFPGADGMLHAETRPVALPLPADARVEAIVAALLAGPKTAGLAATMPPGVALTDAYVDPQGVAYLDFGAKDQPQPPASGSELELLRVYSVVDTVTGAEPRVRAVVLLWNGSQRTTFAGHVDTTSPLLADRRWVR